MRSKSKAQKVIKIHQPTVDKLKAILRSDDVQAIDAAKATINVLHLRLGMGLGQANARPPIPIRPRATEIVASKKRNARVREE